MSDTRITRIDAFGYSSIGRKMYEVIEASKLSTKQIFAVKRNHNDKPVFSIDFLVAADIINGITPDIDYADRASIGRVSCFNIVSSPDKKTTFFYRFSQNEKQRKDFSKASQRSLRVIGYSTNEKIIGELEEIDKTYFSSLETETPVKKTGKEYSPTTVKTIAGSAKKMPKEKRTLSESPKLTSAKKRANKNPLEELAISEDIDLEEEPTDEKRPRGFAKYMETRRRVLKQIKDEKEAKAKELEQKARSDGWLLPESS